MPKPLLVPHCTVTRLSLPAADYATPLSLCTASHEYNCTDSVLRHLIGRQGVYWDGLASQTTCRRSPLKHGIRNNGIAEYGIPEYGITLKLADRSCANNSRDERFNDLCSETLQRSNETKGNMHIISN